jgi:simple sugar transport system ATP-binding protein
MTVSEAKDLILQGIFANIAAAGALVQVEPNASKQPDEAKFLIGGKMVGVVSAFFDKVSIMRNIFMGRAPTTPVGLLRWLNVGRMAQESVKALEGVALALRSPDAIAEQLSDGQRQGVAIARAMYFKTKRMILDEPTNTLSVKESHKALNFVTDLQAQGVSSIFITHNLQHVHLVADRMVVLSQGSKVGDYRKQDTSVDELTSLIVEG